MSDRFCSHLQEYGRLFGQAEEAYRTCNEGLDTVLAEGPERESLDRLTVAVENWLERDRLLREALVELVGQGRVRLPKRKKPGQGRVRKSAPICAECGFRIPRLTTPEWRVAGNGVVAFRGCELPLNDPAAEQEALSGAEEVGV